MKIKQIMVFVVLAVFCSLSSAHAFPFFILQKAGGRLVVVDNRPSYSDPVVGGPFSSTAEAQLALQSLAQFGNSSGSLPLREERSKLATSSLTRENRSQSSLQSEGAISFSSLGTKSTAANAPLATLPLGDFSELLAREEFAPVSQLYSSVPAYPELSTFQLSQFPGALGPSPLTPIPLPQSTVTSIPNLPQPGFSVPQIQVPVTAIPGLPAPVFMSPLPLALGWR